MHASTHYVYCAVLNSVNSTKKHRGMKVYWMSYDPSCFTVMTWPWKTESRIEQSILFIKHHLRWNILPLWAIGCCPPNARWPPPPQKIQTSSKPSPLTYDRLVPQPAKAFSKAKDKQFHLHSGLQMSLTEKVDHFVCLIDEANMSIFFHLDLI